MSLEVFGGSSPVNINVNGGSLVNYGPATVYYRNRTPVTSSDTPLAAGSRAVLDGAQWLMVPTGSGQAVIDVVPLPPAITVRDERLVISDAAGDATANAHVVIQSALNTAKAASGGHVYVPPGTYLLSTSPTDPTTLGSLLIASNTKLELHPDAVIRRNTDADGMVRPDNGGFGAVNDTGPGVYAGTSNVEICGGTWDGNKAAFPSAHNILSSVHGENWHVHDTTLQNCFAFHFLEFNSSRHCVARNVRFLDFDATTTSKEMLQVDVAATPVRGGLADATPCQDIVVDHCYFRNGDRGVGTHTSALHRDIKVTNCEFDTMREECVRAQDWFGAVILGNTIVNCSFGIYLTSTSQTIRGVSVIGNTFSLAGSTASGFAIYADGASTSLRVQEFEIIGNTAFGTGSGAASSGIQVRFAKEGVVANNHVSGWTASGVLIFKSQKVAATGNSLHRNNTTPFATHGDLTLAGSTSTDSQDLNVNGNNIDTMYVGPFGNRIAMVGNIVSGTQTADATNVPTNFNKVANFINGTWTP